MHADGDRPHLAQERQERLLVVCGEDDGRARDNLATPGYGAQGVRRPVQPVIPACYGRPRTRRTRSADRSRRAGGGGERGIRTPGTLSGSTVFKTAALNHSAISPWNSEPGTQRLLS